MKEKKTVRQNADTNNNKVFYCGRYVAVEPLEREETVEDI